MLAINRAAFNEDLGNLADPTADQYDTTLRVVLDTHAPAQGVYKKALPVVVSSVATCLQRRESDAKQSDGGDPLDLTFTEICTGQAKHFVTNLVQKAVFTTPKLQKLNPPKKCTISLTVTASRLEPNALNFQP